MIYVFSGFPYIRKLFAGAGSRTRIPRIAVRYSTTRPSGCSLFVFVHVFVHVFLMCYGRNCKKKLCGEHDFPYPYINIWAENNKILRDVLI